jgi:hypothetical protein
MILGDYIGFGESLKDEFKEFVLRLDPELFTDSSHFKEIINIGILPNYFNDIVMENIFHYFRIYLPKYISAFANCEELEEGFLYFGVNNSGEITGIPFQGEINEVFVSCLIEKIKQKLSLDSKDDSFIDDLFKEIQIEFIKLEKNLDYLEDSATEEINERIEKYDKYKNEFKEFSFERSKWLNEVTSFNNKISYMILDRKSRSDIAAFARKNAHGDLAMLKQAEILDSDEIIEILNGIQLNDYKNSTDNVYYWVMTYKDMVIQEIRSRKPVKPLLSFNTPESMYISYFQLLTKMRYKFILNNSDCNYYLIKIRIPGKKKQDIYYQHPYYDGRWIKKIRSINEQGPCCL